MDRLGFAQANRLADSLQAEGYKARVTRAVPIGYEVRVTGVRKGESFTAHIRSHADYTRILTALRNGEVGVNSEYREGV